MTRKTDYTNAAQQRLLQLVDLLAGHELAGVTPSQIATSLSCGASTVTRDLDNLRTAGWAELTKMETWRLTPHVVQMSVRYATALRQARTELDDNTQRYG